MGSRLLDFAHSSACMPFVTSDGIYITRLMEQCFSGWGMEPSGWLYFMVLSFTSSGSASLLQSKHKVLAHRKKFWQNSHKHVHLRFARPSANLHQYQQTWVGKAFIQVNTQKKPKKLEWYVWLQMKADKYGLQIPEGDFCLAKIWSQLFGWQSIILSIWLTAVDWNNSVYPAAFLQGVQQTRIPHSKITTAAGIYPFS